MVALANAQKELGNFDLGAPGFPKHELVTSCEPSQCATELFHGRVSESWFVDEVRNAEAIGYDEGPKPRMWARALEVRGISVAQNVCRKEAVAVLREYKKRGGMIYNPHH